MSRLLVHITSGPEHPTRAALGLLVARAALSNGHDVDVFFAGDAVALLRDATMDLVHGVGTGSLREHYQALAAGGATFYASGMSSRARDVNVEALGEKSVEFVQPERLVELVFGADRVLSY